MSSRTVRRSLLEAYPEIAKEWDAERNSMAASAVGVGSRTSYWWRCPSGHPYQITVATRIRTKGCRKCNAAWRRERVRIGRLRTGRSLADVQPNLVAEWHPEKNGKVTPQTISFASKRQVWWRCSGGHEWQATPGARNRGTGCPECWASERGEIVRAARFKKSGRSFAEAHPLLLTEWDWERNTLDPTKLSPKSNLRAAWVCKLGHHWEATITNRTHNGSNCPECVPQSSRLEMALLVELRSVYGQVEWRHKVGGVECDVLIPEKAIGIEVDGGYWHRAKAESDKAKTTLLATHGITLIRVRDDTLPAVPGLVVHHSNKGDEFATVLAVLGKLADIAPDPAIIDYVSKGQRRNEAGYRELVARLPAPPVGKSLADTNPQVAAEWDYETNAPLTPDLFSSGSEQKVAWVCSDGHRWLTSIKHRARVGSGCPLCARLSARERLMARRIQQAGTLADGDPEILLWWDAQANELTPDRVPARYSREFWWKCPKGHRFQRTVTAQRDKRNCPKC